MFEVKQLADALKIMNLENKTGRKQIDETEKRYQYDIRLLNTLATSGLKATSIAHEMYNSRNSIDENIDYIIKALRRYELWDIVNDTENRKYIHRDVPALLQKNQKINKKMITFMDTMLAESEKEQFLPENIVMQELFEDIKSSWERDYSWVDIQLCMEEGLEFKSARDIFRVIFDNLILKIKAGEDELKICERVKKALPDFPKIALTFSVTENDETSRKNQDAMKCYLVYYNKLFNTDTRPSMLKSKNLQKNGLVILTLLNMKHIISGTDRWPVKTN